MAAQHAIDDIDFKIVKLLAANGRMSIREIARELGLAVSTTHVRLQRLVSSGVIKRFTIIPDYAALGYNVTAVILLQVEGGKIIEAEERLASEPNVIAVYDVTGDYDVIVVARFRKVEELDEFVKRLNKLPFTKRTVTSIALRIVKEDPVAPLLEEKQAQVMS